MIDRMALGEQAYHLTQACLRKREQPSTTPVERIAGITLKMLEAGIPLGDIEYALTNAKVLTEAGIEYTRNNQPPARHHLRLVTPTPPFEVAETERDRVRVMIEQTRLLLSGPA